MPVRMQKSLSPHEVAKWFDYMTDNGAWVVSCSWNAKAADYALPDPIAKATSRCARDGRGGSDSDTPWELACCEELAIDFSEIFLIANDGEGWSAVSWAGATLPNIVQSLGLSNPLVTRAGVYPEERERFREVAESELLSLNEGNLPGTRSDPLNFPPSGRHGTNDAPE